MPEVKILDIRNLKVSTSQTIDKDGVTHDVTRLSFESDVAPISLARILHFQRQRFGINMVVESPQTEMDLVITPVNVKTGEVPIEDR